MKITVGGREQIANAKVLVPENEDVWIEFVAGNWPIKLNIVFVIDTLTTEFRITVKGEGEIAKLEIANWTTEYAFSMPHLMAFGETEGRLVEYVAAGQRLNGVRALDISFFWAATNGKR